MGSNPAVRCWRCRTTIARLIPDKVALPLDARMFVEAKEGYGNPFPIHGDHVATWPDLFCPICSNRAFICEMPEDTSGETVKIEFETGEVVKAASYIKGQEAAKDPRAPVKCNICGNTYKGVAALANHKRQSHTKEEIDAYDNPGGSKLPGPQGHQVRATEP